MNPFEQISDIELHLSMIMETSGIKRAVECVTIAKMLHELADYIHKRDEDYDAERKSLMECIEQLRNKEEKEND